ncbi:hypothetical protein TUZN_1411 [Thermoproteus uzoniensis 768-20]|uniref:Uncharacterized protein n=1 Tax=Thermoproteus uzoniensis (strain 768-20) TaxID=999630 RepID=F2L1M8_THEU7|nr:hypothetical protein [Thermoproteus uzoniensis]AEA12884.1 hypothetical protein TUZN_1411 [Thermoproteus uzoniensis 768-20]
MLEELIERAEEAARRSGRRGWALVRLSDLAIVGVFQTPAEARKAAKEPGLYLLTEVG